MPGYKHPCRWCGQFVEFDSNVCPFCGKLTPTGSLRCPKCKSPIEEGWKACGHCGLALETICPQCKEKTFFGSQCQLCGAVLTYTPPVETKKKWWQPK